MASYIIIGKGSLGGKGVYAAKDFKKSEVVVEYNLKPLTQKEVEDLPERYVNHSGEPNT